VSWLRRIVAGLSPPRPGFDPRSVRLRFVVQKVAMWQVSLPVLLFSSVSTIPPVVRAHSFICHRRCVVLATDRDITSLAWEARYVSRTYEASNSRLCYYQLVKKPVMLCEWSCSMRRGQAHVAVHCSSVTGFCTATAMASSLTLLKYRRCQRLSCVFCYAVVKLRVASCARSDVLGWKEKRQIEQYVRCHVCPSVHRWQCRFCTIV
jgi:hypothetical protein